MVEHGSEVKAIKVKEIRRQTVYVPKSMTTNQVMEKYGLKPGAAYTARKKGIFVKNYSRPQVKVDPSKFNAALCYNIAGKVFWRNLSRDLIAMSIRDDLIQEAVKSMWEKSGLLVEKCGPCQIFLILSVLRYRLSILTFKPMILLQISSKS
jgi:hypothetical protein